MAEYRHQRELDAPPLQLSRVAALCATTLAGLAVGCVILNRIVTNDHWHPPLPRFEAVLSEVDAAKDSVDVLFFGPSHMMTDIDPRIFDETAAGLGLPVQSYNFSVEGLRASERDYLLGELERIRPSKLKYVLVKPDLWLHTDFENVFSTRARYFAEPANTWRDLGVRLGSNKPLFPYRVMTSGLLALGGIVHFANIGVASELLLPPKGNLKGKADERHPERRGYVPLIKQHRDFGGAPDDGPYPGIPVAETPRELAPVEVEMMKDLFDGIARLGARPVVLIPPVGNANLLETEETLGAMKRSFPDVPVLSYHLGGPHPELYAKLSYWEDMDHLSVEGAKLFSALLAKHYVELVQKGGSAP